MGAVVKYTCLQCRVEFEAPKSARRKYCSLRCSGFASPKVTPARKGRGAQATWLKDRIGYDGDDCLIWPFFRLPAPHGRGSLGYMGKIVYAHRLMCIFAHGEPPTPKHQAAHNCGNGHLGCVNPRHLEWKTSSQNQQDRKKHGTQAGNTKGPTGKLSFAKAAEIRKLRANGLLLEELARRFDVTEGAIRKVCKGETWADRPQSSAA